MLATTTKDHPFDWEEQLQRVCFAYNTSVQVSTGYTPFFFMLGREAKMPIDLMYQTGNQSNVPVNDYAVQLKSSLEDALMRTAWFERKLAPRQKDFYDRKVHGEPYKTGDLVWMHTTVVPPGHSRKLHHPWTGPFKVIQRLSESNYKVKGL